MEKRPEFEYEPDQWAGITKDVNKTCVECGGGFVIHMPVSWFDNKSKTYSNTDKIIEKNLPAGYSAEKLRKSLNENICGGCKNKEKIERIANQMNASSGKKDATEVKSSK
jgi:hypothetical protein